MSNQEPVVFGRYLLEQKLASGGMGEIFLARMQGAAGFEKKVVIKRILPHLAESEEFVERFLDEGRLVVKLAHGNIVQVLDMGQVDGHYFLAMEHVDGMDLRQILRRLAIQQDHIPTELALYILGEVARGLAYAHSRTDEDGNNLGIIHRDVSPSNIMLTRGGEVKLLDFGIAKAASRMVHSVSGSLHGKFLYMSPEQAAGKSLDRRSDLFSLGIVGYELVTGKRPFQADAELRTLDLIRAGEHARPSTIRKDLPEAVEDIIERCLEVDPERRYSSADELHRTVLKYLVDRREIVSNVDLASFVRPLLPPRNPTSPISLDQALNQELDALLHGGSPSGHARTSTPTRMGSARAGATGETGPGGIGRGEIGLGELTQPPATHSGPHPGTVDTSTTNRTNLDHIEEAPPMPRASRNRVLIASVVLLVGVLVTLNVVMLSALKENKPTPPRQGPSIGPPVALVTPDAGPSTEDAGPAETPDDAGTLDEDAGPTVEDAGSLDEDAGPVVVIPVDAGPAEAEDSGQPDEDEDASTIDEAPDAGDPKADSDAGPKDAGPNTPEPRLELTGLPRNATVTIDGATTPSEDGSYPLPAGDEPVEIRVAAKGYETWRRTLDRSDLDPNETLHHITVRATARRKTITIRTVPTDALITVDGRALGKGKQNVSVAWDDPVRVKVSRKDYETSTLTLRYGSGDTTVTLTAREMGTLKTRIYPYTAKVEIDGKPFRRKNVVFSTKLAPGKHTIKVTGNNGKSVVKAFEIKANKVYTLPTIDVKDQ